MKRSNFIGMLLALMPVLFIAIFVGLPALMAIAFSLGYTGGPNASVALLQRGQGLIESNGLTLEVYQKLFTDRSFQRDLVATLWVTLLAVALILAVGWGLALYMRFSHGWFVNLVSALYLVPLFIPVVIASYAIVTFWNANGYLASLLMQLFHLHFGGFGYTLIGIVIAQLWVNLPFSVLLLASGLQAVPDSLVEAARDVGASPVRILFRVILPLNVLPTLIVSTFTGIGILGSFTVPYLTGPNAPLLLGVTMTQYYQAFNQPQGASAIAVLVFLMASGLGVLYVWANVRENQKSGAVQ